MRKGRCHCLPEALHPLLRAQFTDSEAMRAVHLVALLLHQVLTALKAGNSVASSDVTHCAFI